MAQYSRVFITLKQDRAGYGQKSREPSGRAVIEVKDGRGKITVFAQELKGEAVYKAYIVSGANDCVAVKMGSLNADGRGKAELKWEFDPFDVEGTGIQIDAFDVVSVVVRSKTETAWVLTGYRGGDVLFKEKFHEAVKPGTKHDIETEAQREHTAELSPASAPEQTINEQDESDEPKPLQMFVESEPNVETAASEPASEAESVETAATEPAVPEEKEREENPPDSHAKFKSMAQRFNKELEQLESLMQVDTAAGQRRGLDTIMESNAVMSPFQTGFDGVKWVRISLKELTHLPRSCWKLGYDPYVSLAFSKYRHLMLGAYAGRQRYILALPDAFDPARERHAKYLGFDLFRTSDNIIEGHKDANYGYWLMEFET
jgi:hypothetical protein